MNGQLPEGLTLASLDDGDEFELNQQFTIGRHLNNDIIVAGEDVFDYHARGQIDERGLQIVPLNGATIEVNGVFVSESWRVVPTDELRLGPLRFELRDQSEPASEALSWTVHYKGEEVAVQSALTIGRGASAGISFNNSHISREHARLFIGADGNLWLLDLNSANGTFVNGKRLLGGCRLFHGDELSFDQLAMQVLGHGQDLTPARKRRSADLEAPLAGNNAALDPIDGTMEMHAVTLPEALQSPGPVSPGCYLIGQSSPVSGQIFALRFGATTIGREANAEICVDDPGVSARHAELTYRADGVAIANLFSTNGTRVNGKAVDSVMLANGDVIAVGNVSFLLHETSAEPAKGRFRIWLPWAIGGAVAAAVVLALVLQ